MHIIQEEIGLPKISEKSMGDFHAMFTISPLPQGYGTTLGNAMRRVLLSSLPGAAVTGVKIKGITHEYDTIKGVTDSVLDILLNLKQLAISMDQNEPAILKLSAKKTGEVTASMIETPGGVKVHNPELYLTRIEKGGSLEMEIIIEKSVGYRAALIGAKKAEAGLIQVDASHSYSLLC